MIPLFLGIAIVALVLILFIAGKFMARRKAADLAGIEVSRIDELGDPEEAEVLWDIYGPTFEPINALSPCKQSFDREHFIEVLKDKTVRKYVIDKEGFGYIGVAFVTNDLKNTPWISKDYFEKNFPNEYSRQAVFYFIGLAILQEFRGNRYSIALIEYIIDDLPGGAVLGFDHSKNVNPMLHRFTSVVRQAAELQRVRIDEQHYHVVRRKT